MLIETHPKAETSDAASGLCSISIQTPAKLNLFLEVLGKRPDGFHEIESLMTPISLFDRITVEKLSSSDIELQIQTPQTAGVTDSYTAPVEDPAWQIPADERNLVWKALEQVRRRLDITHGFRVRLEKHIPASAGLAGGSGNAAGAIVAALILTHGWDRGLATEICSSIGSDIPFFLGGVAGIGNCVAQGRGEQLELLPFAPEMSFIVTHPPAGCCTRTIYENYRKQTDVRNAAKIIDACEDGQYRKIGAQLFNALQFSAMASNEWIEKQLSLLSTSGCEFVLMTGSGSSCFALLDGHENLRLAEGSQQQVSRQEWFQQILERAKRAGITRVYQCAAWYAPSIEDQLTQDPINHA